MLATVIIKEQEPSSNMAGQDILVEPGASKNVLHYTVAEIMFGRFLVHGVQNFLVVTLIKRGITPRRL